MTFSQPFVVSRSAEPSSRSVRPGLRRRPQAERLATKPVERSTELVAGRERSHFDVLSANGSGQWLRRPNYGPQS
jgi:hypothetical protein